MFTENEKQMVSAGLVHRNRPGLGQREVRLGGVTQETLTADWAWQRVRHSDPQTENTQRCLSGGSKLTNVETL